MGRKGPVVSQDEVERMIFFLKDRGWMTAKRIGEALQLGERRIRAIAQASKGHILGGQDGYRLTFQATLVESGRTKDFLLSQSTEMRKRALEIDRVHHSRQIPRCLQ